MSDSVLTDIDDFDDTVTGLRAEPRPKAAPPKKRRSPGSTTSSAVAKKPRAKARQAASGLSLDNASPLQWLTLPHVVFVLLLIAFLSLQGRLWFGEGSLAEVWKLRQEIAQQQQANLMLAERNGMLSAEVDDLKASDSLGAVEERARSRLGMIKNDEVFYLIIDNP